jgi:undecaprenyl-diphosphatase
MLSLALVAAVGLGRIYAGAHLPLDVVGGVAIGALIGIAANAVVGLPSDRRRVNSSGTGL